ncbi:MAG: histidine kinase [Actinobacteria bacterium]|nr:histidine kinase [Actinomycetota bacterium]
MSGALTETRRPARWPWLVVAGFIATAVVACVLVVENGESVAEQVPFIMAFALFGVIGALIVSREPGNRIGGLLLYGSGATAASFAAGELVTYLVRRGETGGPLVGILGLLSDAGWIVGIIPVLLFIPLLFPDGHLPSRRWWPLAALCWTLIGFLFIAIVFATPLLAGSSGPPSVENPFYVSAIDRVEIPDVVISVMLLAVLVGSVASLVVRFRRSRGDERQQIKWVALALVLLVFSFVLSEVLLQLGVESNLVDSFVSGLAFLAIPVSIGIAVLRFRLYDLDVVVKKTLVAGALALFGIAIYGAVVWLFGAFAAERESSATVFVVALLLGLAFRPVARLVRRVADHLVYGRRATPYEVLTEFSERVGDAYATEDVLGRMAQILGQGTGAGSARVWLRLGDELRPVAAWPSDAPEARSAPVRGDALPELAGETAVEVRDAGELLGALSVTMPPSDPMNPSKERLVRDLAAQAGLVLRNVRLVEELRAAQRRLVTAQDAERRRLERNIHDGAQQRLVALSVKARLARGLTEREPSKTSEMLEQIEAELQTALEDLRDLARGIYPPLLADKGLGPALEAQARRSPLPVIVEAEALGRYPQEVEAAVYFSCLEALQNASKYADATQARVKLEQANGHLSFEVADDGRGFDPETTGYGTGLQGIADRLAALDGELVIRSRPGGGTRISGMLAVAVEPPEQVDGREEDRAVADATA